MEYTYDNPDCLWIQADAFDGGTGTFEKPFASLESALERVKPGQAIVLQAGEYPGDCNIQVSGTAAEPIRIVAMPGAEVVIRSACWFFYDTSDLIVEGMSFVDAPRGAISVVGACSRNRFDGIRFVNCSSRGESACTLYIGGAGGVCNLIENCTFVRSVDAAGTSESKEDGSIGLMVAQGDMEHDSPIVNCLVRRNRVENYGYGIVVGGDGSRRTRCGHIIEYNRIVNASCEGILVKSGDTRIRSNVIEHGTGTALSLRSELDGTVDGNRIVDCRRGVFVHGTGHSVAGNCIVRCSEGAVRVGGASDEDSGTTLNCFIENNTFVDCGASGGGDENRIAGVLVDRGTTGLIQRNLITGTGKPYAVVTSTPEQTGETATQFVIKDNIAAGGCEALDGVGAVEVVFADAAGGDYSNESGCGAGGWVLKPQGYDPAADTGDDEGVYRAASMLEDESGNPIIPGSEAGTNDGLFGNYYASDGGDGEDPDDDDDEDEESVMSTGDDEEW
ncbi:MAG: right-handed parallel beta-helix repeat-containing protein [Chitinispirillaceae bacterium]|nr:right-handed parallel beta-helix repeat-containing protein [Chitinispirillaceae bacterium]